MSRRRTTIPFNPEQLQSALKKNGWNNASIADEMDITRQAVGAWFQEERIPPARMSDIARIASLDANEVHDILDKKHSIKDLAREIRHLREENDRFRAAIIALASHQENSERK